MASTLWHKKCAEQTLTVGNRAEGRKSFFFLNIFVCFSLGSHYMPSVFDTVQYAHILDSNCVIVRLFLCHLSVQHSAEPRWGWLLLCAAANAFYRRLVDHYSQCSNKDLYVSFHWALILWLKIIAEQMYSSLSIDHTITRWPQIRVIDEIYWPLLLLSFESKQIISISEHIQF